MEIDWSDYERKSLCNQMNMYILIYINCTEGVWGMHVRWNYPPCIQRCNKECLPFNTTLVLRGFIPGFSVTVLRGFIPGFSVTDRRAEISPAFTPASEQLPTHRGPAHRLPSPSALCRTQDNGGWQHRRICVQQRLPSCLQREDLSFHVRFIPSQKRHLKSRGRITSLK